MNENDITYQIRGAIYDVYKTLGPGLLESVYEEALTYELQQRGLNVERQKPVPVQYKGMLLKTELRLDLLVEDKVIVELKSVDEIKRYTANRYSLTSNCLAKKSAFLSTLTQTTF